MRFIIAMFLAVTFATANDTKPHLLKTVVSGGNSNVTFGQVIAGYKKNGFNVGFRIPNKVALSVMEYEEITTDMLAYPNPTIDGNFKLGVDGVESVKIFDLKGTDAMFNYNNASNSVVLINRGVFFVRATTFDKKVYTTTVIFN